MLEVWKALFKINPNAYAVQISGTRRTGLLFVRRLAFSSSRRALGGGPGPELLLRGFQEELLAAGGPGPRVERGAQQRGALNRTSDGVWRNHVGGCWGMVREDMSLATKAH